MSFTTTTIYTSTTLLDTNATVWNLEVAIRSGDQSICQYNQAGPVLYENCYSVRPEGRLTARTMMQEWEKDRRNPEAIGTSRKRGPVPRYDLNRDAAIVDAYKSSGARTYAEGVRLLNPRYSDLTRDELRKAVDRQRHPPRR